MPKTAKSPAKTAKQATHSPLVDQILHAIREKKGFDISVLYVGQLRNVVTDYFIICSGSSDRQTTAIADSIDAEVNSLLHEKPWHVEGRQTGEWLLMDYVNVVVHIFIPRAREFYNLEELWGDAEITHYAE